MVEYRSNIWRYESTGAPDVETLFHNLADAATVETKFGSNHNAIFNSVNVKKH